jgi:hypothetical protein
MDNWGTGVRFPPEATNFSLHSVQTGRAAYQISYSIVAGRGGSLPGLKGLGCETDPLLPATVWSNTSPRGTSSWHHNHHQHVDFRSVSVLRQVDHLSVTLGV